MMARFLDRLWFSAPGAAVRAGCWNLVHLMSPSWCVGCRAPAVGLCQQCHDDVRLLSRVVFRAEESAQALPIVSASADGLEVLPVLAAAEYRTVVAEAVLAFKDHERTTLRRDLAAALERAVHAALELVRQCGDDDEQAPRALHEVLLVRVPPSRASLLRRGRDPLGELIGELTVPPNLHLRMEILRNPRKPLTMGGSASNHRGLSAAARRQRSRLEVAVPQNQLEGAAVVLIDDVLTTGATLARAYEALTEAGAQVRAAAVIAAVQAPSPRSAPITDELRQPAQMPLPSGRDSA